MNKQIVAVKLYKQLFSSESEKLFVLYQDGNLSIYSIRQIEHKLKIKEKQNTKLDLNIDEHLNKLFNLDLFLEIHPLFNYLTIIRIRNITKDNTVVNKYEIEIYQFNQNKQHLVYQSPF